MMSIRSSCSFPVELYKIVEKESERAPKGKETGERKNERGSWIGYEKETVEERSQSAWDVMERKSRARRYPDEAVGPSGREKGNE